MKYIYVCPYCTEALNDDQSQINFIIRNSRGDLSKIRINPEPGNYSYTCASDFPMIDGELINFLCPHCEDELVSERHEEFVGIKMMVNEHIFFEVIFSRRKGIRRTYVITEDLIEKFGDELSNCIGYQSSYFTRGKLDLPFAQPPQKPFY